MSRRETHLDLIEAEFYWHGGILDPPKVYDSGTSHSVDPHVRGLSRDGGTGERRDGQARHVVVYEVDDAGWTLRVEERT